MAVTTYRAANFQDGLTLNMPGGTGTGTSTWTLNQSTASLPSGTFRFIVYTNLATFSTTKEICEGTVTGANTVSVTLRNAEGDTTAIDHPNGSIFAIVNTAGMENAQNDAINDLYLTGGTALVTAGEAYAATTFVTNAGANQAYSLPTLLYQDASTGRWFKMAGTSTLGAHTKIGMAYEASSGAAASVRIYLPGSLITVASMAAELGRNFTNSLTSGACETTVLPPYYTYVGFLANATTFKFTGYQINNVTNKSIPSPVVSGEAFSVRDALYLDNVTGKAFKSVNNISRRASGWYNQMIAAQAATGADQTVLAYTNGAVIPGFSGLTPGAPYYPSSTAGTLSTTRTLYNSQFGYAQNANTFVLSSGGKNNDWEIEQAVIAGENWTTGDLLYQKKSDGRFYRADADVAESGICEVPAIALQTHTGGAASTQAALFPGSILFGLPAGTSGDRIYPSATTGAAQANTPASYDTFYRVLGFFIGSNILDFTPQEMQFLPTGIQEKGYCGTTGISGGQAGHGVNFKKIMVNTPSSITLTQVYTDGTGTTNAPTAVGITRFGFEFNQTASVATTYIRGYTYQTVGN